MFAVVALAVVAVVLGAAAYDRPKRRPDWRHLTNDDRIDMYERARFAVLGDRDLESNVRREAAGIAAKERIITACRLYPDGILSTFNLKYMW